MKPTVLNPMSVGKTAMSSAVPYLFLVRRLPAFTRTTESIKVYETNAIPNCSGNIDRRTELLAESKYQYLTAASVRSRRRGRHGLAAYLAL